MPHVLIPVSIPTEAVYSLCARAALATQAELQYNIALCCFKLKQYSQALKHLAEIVERGVREHPELGVGR
jgi:tetratricopeptide repeat protein 30